MKKSLSSCLALIGLTGFALLASCFPGKDSRKVQPLHNLPFTSNHMIGEDGSGHGNLKDAYRTHTTLEDKHEDRDKL